MDVLFLMSYELLKLRVPFLDNIPKLDGVVIVVFGCFPGFMCNVKGFEVCNQVQLFLMMYGHIFPHFGHPVEQISY